MSHPYILGIDVSKAKLDIALLLPAGKFRSEVVPNTAEGFKKLAVWMERNEGRRSGSLCRLRLRNSAPLSCAAARWSA